MTLLFLINVNTPMKLLFPVKRNSINIKRITIKGDINNIAITENIFSCTKQKLCIFWNNQENICEQIELNDHNF